MKREGFEEKEWIGLKWVRTYITHEGAFPDAGVDKSFRKAYSPGEQKAVFATAKCMLFYNMLFNVFSTKGSRLVKECSGNT